MTIRGSNVILGKHFYYVMKYAYIRRFSGCSHRMSYSSFRLSMKLCFVICSHNHCTKLWEHGICCAFSLYLIWFWWGFAFSFSVLLLSFRSISRERDKLNWTMSALSFLFAIPISQSTEQILLSLILSLSRKKKKSYPCPCSILKPRAQQ